MSFAERAAIDRKKLLDELSAIATGMGAVVLCAKDWGWTKEEVVALFGVVWEMDPLRKAKT